MTSIIWPPSLPDLRGYASNGGTAVLHPETKDTEMDDGPDLPRRRSLYVETPLTIQLEVLPDLFVVFKQFHLVDLNTGTKRFQAPVLLPNMSIGTRTCRIKGKVSAVAPKRFKWAVSFLLLVQDW